MGDLSNKRIITVALTGAVPSKQDNPNIPTTPQEIADDVYACWKAGAAIAHVHVRDDEGVASMSHDKFRETVNLIRAHKDCDIVLNLTTSGSVLPLTDFERSGHVGELKPEMASYDCGTMNWLHKTLFVNSPPFLEYLGNYLIEQNVKPEIEVFDPGMIYNAAYYIKKGMVKTPAHFQFCMGAAGGIAATVDNLVFMKRVMEDVAPGSTWSAFGIGKGHMPTLYAAIALGGHIRIGMEDNVMFGKGQLAESNSQFVSRAKRIIEEFGCEAATPEEARQILGLTRKV